MAPSFPPPRIATLSALVLLSCSTPILPPQSFPARPDRPLGHLLASVTYLAVSPIFFIQQEATKRKEVEWSWYHRPWTRLLHAPFLVYMPYIYHSTQASPKQNSFLVSCHLFRIQRLDEDGSQQTTSAVYNSSIYCTYSVYPVAPFYCKYTW